MKKIAIIIAVIMCSLSVAAQSLVKGLVTDEQNQPLSGVVVSVVNNPGINVVTNSKGEFAIDARKGDKLLFNAFSNQQFTLSKERNSYTTELTVNSEPLLIARIDLSGQEVDLGVSFFRDQKTSTAAVSTIRSDEFARNSSVSPSNALFGNVLGLTSTQNTSVPQYERARFDIRGLQTLSSNGVLVLIDGIDRSLDEVLIEEIQSVSVLRDAAAIAMHGYKGANGVVSVRTKRGMKQGLEVKATYDRAFRTPVRLPKFADSYMYANAMNEAYKNDGKAAPRYTDVELGHFKNGTLPYYYPNVDWVKESIRDHGSTDIATVSFTGGGNSVKYYTSVGMLDDRGFLQDNIKNEGYSTQLRYSKLNLRTNLDITVNKNTDVEFNVFGVLAEYNRPTRNSGNIFDAFFTLPSAAYPIKNEDGLWGGSLIWPQVNPIAGIEGTGYTRSSSRTLMADMKISHKLNYLLEGLKVYGGMAFDSRASYWDFRTSNYEYSSTRVTSFDDWGDPLTFEKHKAGNKTELAFSRDLGEQQYLLRSSAGVTYDKQFGDHSVFSALMGEYEHYIGKGQNTTLNRQNFNLYAAYSYKQKYNVDLVLNYAGSNRLPEVARYNFAPTLSASYLISQEQFMQDVKWLNNLKVRASVGRSYLDYAPAWNLTEQSFADGDGYIFTDNYTGYGGVSESRVPMKTVKAERANRANVGIEATVFGSLSLSLDAYTQRRDQIFVGRGGQISAVYGGTDAYANIGAVNSKGIELGLNYTKSFGDVWFTTGGQFTFNRSKIIEQAETPTSFDYLRRTGLPVNQIFGLESIGFFSDEADILGSPTQKFSVVKPGDIKYKDQNGDGFIDNQDQISLGFNNTTPEMYFSYNLNVEWKGFGLYALFQGATNYSQMVMTKSIYKPLIGNTTISEHYYQHRWTPETAATAKYPRLTAEANDNNYQNSAVWMRDLSYLKLRSCELYYNIPSKYIKKLRMSSAKVYVRGMDLFSWDKIKILDPETMGVSYPTDRSIHVGINLVF